MPKLLLSSRNFLSLGLLGVLLAGGAMSLSACGSGRDDASGDGGEDSLAKTMDFSVTQVDEWSKLGEKQPDGQYIVVKAKFGNKGNKTIELDPKDFNLQNITKNEKDQYSQPAETNVGYGFGTQYGADVRDNKLMTGDATKLYPRLQLERYFVFMVPADAKPNQYQITYKPGKMSTPLVSGSVTVNDNRHNDPSQLPAAQ